MINNDYIGKLLNFINKNLLRIHTMCLFIIEFFGQNFHAFNYSIYFIINCTNSTVCLKVLFNKVKNKIRKYG